MEPAVQGVGDSTGHLGEAETTVENDSQARFVRHLGHDTGHWDDLAIGTLQSIRVEQDLKMLLILSAFWELDDIDPRLVQNRRAIGKNFSNRE
jgi:hypothetical protein